MGVITTAYSIPLEKFLLIKSHKKNMDYVLGLKTAEDDGWRFEAYGFDNTVRGLFEILRAGSYTYTGSMLDVERFYYKKNGMYFNYEGYYTWYASALDVEIMAEELKEASFENLKEAGLSAKATDYYGKPILKEDYEIYVGDIDKWKQFLNRTIEKGNYLVFTVI